MMFQTVSGIVVRLNPRNMPVTNVLRQTLNSLAGDQVFHVNHGEITWVNELTKTKKMARTSRKSTQGLQTYHSDGGRAQDMLIDLPVDESTCFEGSSPREQFRLSRMHCETETVRTPHDSHGKHGRKPRYKDKTRENSSW